MGIEEGMKEEKSESGREEEQMTVKAERVSGLEILPAITTSRYLPSTTIYTPQSINTSDQLYSIFIYLPA